MASPQEGHACRSFYPIAIAQKQRADRPGICSYRSMSPADDSCMNNRKLFFVAVSVARNYRVFRRGSYKCFRRRSDHFLVYLLTIAVRRPSDLRKHILLQVKRASHRVAETQTLKKARYA